MTGGNRLLIGVGWPIVFLLFFYRTKLKELVVNRQRSLERVIWKMDRSKRNAEILPDGRRE